MGDKETVILPNSAKAMFSPEEESVGRIWDVVKSEDFLRETDAMFRRGNSPPFSLLVYDDLLVLGIHDTSGNVAAMLHSYSDEHLMNDADIPLALYKQPLFVADKTTDKGEFSRRIKLRADLGWIEYDPDTHILREMKGVPCAAEEFLNSLPAIGRDLFAIKEYEGVVVAVHLQMHNQQVNDRHNGLIVEGIKCTGAGKSTYDDLSMEQVEEMVRQMHPGAIIIREPLFYCTELIDSKPYSCLATKFERAYVSKNSVGL